MNWWPYSIGFLVGLVVGVVAMFVWIAETIAPAMDRIEREKLVYEVRKDDWNRYWTDL